MERWPEVLDLIARRFVSVGGALVLPQPNSSPLVVVSPGLTDAGKDYEQEGWKADFLIPRALAASIEYPNDAFTDRQLASAEEIAAHPFYTEFRARHGLGPLLTGTLSPNGAPVVFSIHRSNGRRPYDEKEVAAFAKLLRHVEMSLRLTIRIAELEVQREALADILTRFSFGVFVLDGSGGVLFHNAAAEKLLNGQIEIVAGRLVSINAGGEDLQREIRAALYSVRVGGVTSRPLLLRLPRDSRTIAVYVLPISSDQNLAARTIAHARAMVIVLPQNDNAPADPAIVRDWLGLTLGEARLASLIGAGHSPREAAMALNITENSARTILKRIFTKVGVSRQAELSALVARIMLLDID